MKLQDLKDKTWETWLEWQDCACVVVQPENYKTDVRAFGDLRRKDTWKRALGTFLALAIARTCIDPVELVTLYLNPPPDDWAWEVRYETFEAFLNIPRGLDAVKAGLSAVFFQHQNPDLNEQEDVSGILELVEATAGVGKLLARS